jgi:hypothetical protein
MKKLHLVLIILCTFSYSAIISQVPDRKGWWKFDDKTNYLKSEVGNDLALHGNATAIDGPKANDNAISVGKDSYLIMTHGLQSTLGSFVNEYTISIDFRVSSTGRWYSFFQTSPTNANDGDCFINTTGNIGVGATGYSSYIIRANEWYRLVVSVKNGIHYKYYLDGQLLYNGTVQSVDGRFSLDKTLLLFADENGEDSEIDCSEVAIWNTPLNSYEIASLGGYGHTVGVPKTRQLVLTPYLQNPSPTSVFISWHDTLDTITKVEYGTTSSLGQSETGVSELISATYRWHTVELTALEPNQEYFYKLVSGSGTSAVYNFKSQPDETYTGKIRFLLLSDTHNSDTTMAVKVAKQARKTMQTLYGNDIHNKINAVLHSGDLVVSGNSIIQWTDQFFAPMSNLSSNIPFLTVTGNHEGEHSNYYKYMKLDNISGYPPPNSFAEKFWSTTIANTMIIGLNTNLTGAALSLQSLWLDTKLAEAESNSKIDFVLLLGHHLSVSELWGEGITYDGGPAYITNQVFPILKKYTKVIQYSYGHTHGFERGTVESNSSIPRTDFRMVCGGGGGGATDRWGSYKNQDFPNIHITFDDYFYQIIEIDVANKAFESFMYSLGNAGKQRNNELRDKWYIKLNQPAPAKPVAATPTIDATKVTFNTSKISGDSLMTVRVQVSDNSDFNKTVIDTMIHWKNIYKVDSNLNPIDKNHGVDLTKLVFNTTDFAGGKQYFYKVKYRDHNLKWSAWSNAVTFNTPTDLAGNTLPTEFSLKQNYPNPFNPETTIEYAIPSNIKGELANVKLKIYDVLGREVATLVEELQQAGNYNVAFNARHLEHSRGIPSGVYFYRLQVYTPGRAGGFSEAKKFVLMK